MHPFLPLTYLLLSPLLPSIRGEVVYAVIDLWPGATGPPAAPPRPSPRPAVPELPCSAQNDTLCLRPSASLSICHTISVAPLPRLSVQLLLFGLFFADQSQI